MAGRKGGREKKGNEHAVPVVQWFNASQEGRTVMLALLTEEGPDAYAMSPLNANLMGEALKEAADAASKLQS